MILAAAVLVLLGLGLFVGGLLTGGTAYYWGCVAACVVAAVLLVLARRRMSSVASGTSAAPGATAAGGAAAGPPPLPVDDEVAAATPAPAEEPVPQELGDPPAEDVEVTDLLLVVDLEDEVLVVDEHPRYHLAGCVHVTGRTTIPLPHTEARSDGFTPCGVCEPDHTLAEQVRARKAAKGS